MSDSQAFYLKYRPQTLGELVGQETVKKTLLSSFQNNKLAHAYLFVGPRGTGKTSTARILAKMVNCEKLLAISDSPLAANSQQPTANSSIPCNECDTCRSITDGSNMDLIEIDAASNRGIEDIRSLREKIKLVPSSCKKKVYIIDEVHMLTTEAFNALLKTLEEPPQHALFVLATTEGTKIPQTILSRVQKLDFKLATPAELLEALEKIVKKEKIEIEEAALKDLIKKSDGSFRDGVKLLDQIASLGEKITVKFLEENLKSSEFESILTLIQSLADKDSKKGLLAISKQVEEGVDIKQLILSLMDALRDLVFIKNEVGEQLVRDHIIEDKYQELVKISEKFTITSLVSGLEVLQTALEKLKFASIPSLPLELAVVEICNKNSELKASVIPTLHHTVRGRNLKVKESIHPSFGGRDPSLIAQDDKKDKIEPEISEVETIVSMKDPEITSSPIPSVTSDVPSTEDSPDIQKLKEKWTFVLETIRPFNFSLEALLRSVVIKDCTPGSVIMEVPYSFHQRILESPKNRDLLESMFSEILGRSIKISAVLGSRPARKEDIANIEVAQDDEIIRAAAEIFNSDTVN